MIGKGWVAARRVEFGEQWLDEVAQVVNLLELAPTVLLSLPSRVRMCSSLSSSIDCPSLISGKASKRFPDTGGERSAF